MEKYDLSDRQLKVLVILATVFIVWLCVKTAAADRADAPPVVSSPTTATPNTTPGHAS